MIGKSLLIASVAAALCAAPPASAQDTSPDGARTAAEDGTVDVIQRWRHDPTTVFDAAEIDLGDLEWIARPLVIFADSPAQPAFQDQMALIAERADTLGARDVIVVTDTDPAAQSDARLQLRPRGFQLTAIGKDGRVAFRKPFPWSVREITRSIDKMPIRQQEIRAGG